MIRQILNDYKNIPGNTNIIRRLISFLFNNSFQLIALYRLSNWLHKNNFLSKFECMTMFMIQNITNCYINPNAEIGDNCFFPHPIGIVIGKHVKIGNNAKIYQNITIGSNFGENGLVGYPTIGDNVTIFASAILIGPLNIGDNATIGAGSVVLHDVKNNTIVAGNPARIIRGNLLTVLSQNGDQ